MYTLLGVFLLVWPTGSTRVLCIGLGIVLVVCGIIDIRIFISNRDGTLYSGGHLVLGVVLAAVGVWLLTQPTLIAVIIPRIMGVLICIHGASNIGDAIVLRRGMDARWPYALWLGLISLGLGAILVCNPFQVFMTAVRCIGLFLIYDGISDLWVTSRINKILPREETEDSKRPDNLH